MIIKRRCDVCGTQYDAKRPTSRYCGTACRTRATRMGGVTALAVPVAVDSTAGTVTAVRTELEAVEQAGSSLGAVALALAARMDSGRETGSAMATIARELRATMDEARASGRNPTSISERLGDELALRRARRGG